MRGIVVEAQSCSLNTCTTLLLRDMRRKSALAPLVAESSVGTGDHGPHGHPIQDGRAEESSDGYMPAIGIEGGGDVSAAHVAKLRRRSLR